MKIELLDSNLNLRTKFLVPQTISLSDVFQVVGSRKQQVGYPKLRRDVEKKGFKNPIVVIPNTLDNYGLAIRQVTSKYIKGWEAWRPYLCMYGNQRIEIALELKVFKLDAIITPNVEWAHATQLKLDAKSHIPVSSHAIPFYTKGNL